MFDRVAAPRIDLYSGPTSEYHGRATFDVTQNVESNLLQIVNNMGTPKSIILQNVTFFPSAPGIVLPALFEKYARDGIIRAEYRDMDSHLWMLADIYISFDAQARGNLLGDLYHFDSIEYSNIVVRQVNLLPQGTLGTT